MRRSHPLFLVTVLLGLLLGASAAVTAVMGPLTTTKALGSNGIIYQLVSGSYGELFPPEQQPSAATAVTEEIATGQQVLALEVTRGGLHERFLVPGSQRLVTESSPTLLYEESTETLYLLWQGLLSGLHPVLNFTSFSNGAWGDSVQLISGAFSIKESLQLSVIRDEPSDRTVVILTWLEIAGGSAPSTKMMAPVVLDAGAFIGSAPVFDLSGLAIKGEEPAKLPAGSEHLLRLQSGGDSSVIIGFLDPSSLRLVTVEAQVLPWALGRLVSKAMPHIVNGGLLPDGPDEPDMAPSRQELALKAADAVLELGQAFHPGTLSYMAEEVVEAIGSSLHPVDTSEGREAIASEVARALLATGARIDASGLEIHNPFRILELVPKSPEFEAAHYVKATLVSSWAIPTSVGDTPRLFLSPSGRDVLLAWQTSDGGIEYVESRREAWREKHRIELGNELSAGAAFEMLENRMRSR